MQDGKCLYILDVYMIYGLQHTSGWVSAGRGSLRKAGAGLEMGQAPSAAAWGSVCVWRQCQTQGTAPRSASPATQLSKFGVLFQGCLL